MNINGSQGCLGLPGPKSATRRGWVVLHGDVDLNILHHNRLTIAPWGGGAYLKHPVILRYNIVPWRLTLLPPNNTLCPYVRIIADVQNQVSPKTRSWRQRLSRLSHTFWTRKATRCVFTRKGGPCVKKVGRVLEFWARRAKTTLRFLDIPIIPAHGTRCVDFRDPESCRGPQPCSPLAFLSLRRAGRALLGYFGPPEAQECWTSWDSQCFGAPAGPKVGFPSLSP